MSTPLRKGAFLAALVLAVPLAGMLSAPAFSDPGNGSGQATHSPHGVAAHGNADHSQGNRGTSGDPSQPQPPSQGDFSGHGANQHGAYDSTRDGSPSGNGNGGGNAVGKPCAGCVGKADNKNPPGQAPDGTDPNAGYECDRNHGIGRTNPAHTGCRPAPPDGETPPPPGNGNGNPPGNGGGGGAAPPAAEAPAQAPSGMPVTGTPIGTIVGVALLLLLAGALLRRTGSGTR
ncbi:MAG: hypothetical protein ACRDT4_09870 [Micromonosporaceae bacterium]